MNPLCPLCKHQNRPGETYCENCGYQLSIAPALPGEFTEITARSAPPSEISAALSPRAALQLPDGRKLFLPNKKKVFIGRNDPDNGVYPDLDLSPYGAAQSGVSRLHLQLSADAHGYWVRDLESTNFTYLNGEKIDPLTNYRLSHGDELKLGSFSVRFGVIREEEKAS